MKKTFKVYNGPMLTRVTPIGTIIMSPPCIKCGDFPIWITASDRHCMACAYDELIEFDLKMEPQ